MSFNTYELKVSSQTRCYQLHTLLTTAKLTATEVGLEYQKHPVAGSPIACYRFGVLRWSRDDCCQATVGGKLRGSRLIGPCTSRTCIHKVWGKAP